jgi:hypothetical protein
MADQKRNPKPEQSQLFKSLTRLFSGPLADYKTQSTLRYRRKDIDKLKFTSASGQTFKKKSYNPFEAIQSNIMMNQSRAERYSDFDQMEFMPEIASSIDIYADEMTTSNQFRSVLHIDSPNDEIKELLHTLFYNVLNIEQNLYGWCRTMVKFGDFFLYLDIDDELGIKNVLGLPSPEIERLEGEDDTNPSYVQYQWNSGGITFENWQIAHFRISGQDRYAPYGTSVLEPARRIWRQLTLLEDAMMAYRIVRAPDRRIFYIDVAGIAPQEVEQYMQKVMTQMKRNQIVDPNTGRVDLRYNPLSIDEDYYIPIRGGSSNTKIDTLNGASYNGGIDDVKYLRDKLFSALKIPQSYLARGENASEDKGTLAQKDIRFARTIQRLQRIIVSELEKIAMIHLFTLGYRNEDILKFKLSLNNPSKIAELQEMEHLRAKVDLVTAAKDTGLSRRWLFKNVLSFSDEEFIRNQRDLFYDKAISQSMEAPAGAEGGGGASPPPMPTGGGPEAAGTPPVGPEAGGAIPGAEAGAGAEAPPAEAPAPEKGGKEDVLLAKPPAKREDDGTVVYADGSRLTAGSNGKVYMPKPVDNRQQGARTRHFKSQWADSYARNTKRNVFQGKSVLDTYAAGIINESKDIKEEIFDKDEQLMNDVQSKLDALSKKFGKKEDKQNGE